MCHQRSPLAFYVAMWSHMSGFLPVFFLSKVCRRNSVSREEMTGDSEQCVNQHEPHPVLQNSNTPLPWEPPLEPMWDMRPFTFHFQAVLPVLRIFICFGRTNPLEGHNLQE